MRIESQVHARAGLLGNPSDGYFGKTISCLVGNFSARVTLEESATLRLAANPEFDQLEFASPRELLAAYHTRGYYGGLRLLQAASKRFFETCAQADIALDGPNFTASYSSDIPLQVGLSGSSALVIATLRSLIRWYGVERHFSIEAFPALALSVEAEELGIVAGMQDRVIQTFGGVMYMDFARELMETRRYGRYERVERTLVPPLFLAYALCPSDSGKIHSDVRRRWHEGDPQVHQAMETFAGFAEEGKAALLSGDHATVSALVRQAFALRREIFGDAVLGPDNLRMVEIANRHGLAATTCGSGGAVYGPAGDPAQNAALAGELEAAGYRYLDLIVGPEYC